jgi:RNA methyltransferase, TrmH family
VDLNMWNPVEGQCRDPATLSRSGAFRKGDAPRPSARDTAPVSRGLIDEFRAARRDPERVVLEGFHALKHALRFGAEIQRVVAAQSADLDDLSARVAPELAARLGEIERVDDASFAQLAPRAPRTGVLALALRPAIDSRRVIADVAPAPMVLLEQPRTMGNLGACVRVAAAAGAAGVLTTGIHDPWHPDAVRGAAGLQFAVPVARLSGVTEEAVLDELRVGAHAAGRPILALDPEGDPLTAGSLPPRAILAFGTERDGLSDALLSRADARIALPMQPGVSSLNLATSVAATLYTWRLSGQASAPREAAR